MPLVGSLAKVCTEFKMPDLTKKVPVILSINVIKLKIIVQFLRIFLFSNVTTQWSKAVKLNHGIREMFSTGSQNQNPPQPNS